MSPVPFNGFAKLREERGNEKDVRYYLVLDGYFDAGMNPKKSRRFSN